MTNTTKPIRVAVIGVGHLGCRHAEKYAAMDDAELVAVCDNNADAAKTIAAKHGCAALNDFKKIENVDAVSVVTPTVHHHAVAAHFLDRGVHTMVEKPITTTEADARDLIHRAEKNNCKLQVGHIERFNPAFTGAQAAIQSPLFIEVHRIAPFSFRSTDIGVIMDLMIHDLDILLHIADSPIKQVHAHGACVITDNEDIAGARIEFESGCVANLTASRLGLKHERKFRIFQRGCYLSLDFLRREGQIIRKGSGFDSVDMTDPDAIQDPLQFITQNLIELESIDPPVDSDSLRDELASFLNAVRTGDAPLVPGEHGLRALQAAHRIRDEAKIISK